MSVSRVRGSLYRVARLLGDYQAIRSGSPRKIERRIARRAVGKVIGRKIMRRI